jgi:NAD(P)-dependent dehydrogenase (short-subunit alcohol dehydrogenase family)
VFPSPPNLNDRSAFEQHLAVNLYGTLDVTRAFLSPRRRGLDARHSVIGWTSSVRHSVGGGHVDGLGSSLASIHQ